jgi:hypothetical protein
MGTLLCGAMHTRSTIQFAVRFRPATDNLAVLFRDDRGEGSPNCGRCCSPEEANTICRRTGNLADAVNQQATASIASNKNGVASKATKPRASSQVATDSVSHPSTQPNHPEAGPDNAHLSMSP